MGLDHGGTCLGMAFRISPQNWDKTVAYLRAREQVTMVYREVTRQIRLSNGAQVTALTYMVDRQHAQYAAKLSLPEQLAHIRAGHGQSGPNRDYVLNTYAHIKEAGAQDRNLAWLAAQLGETEQAVD